MPTFATPEPIAVNIELVVGDVQIIATDRRDTVVQVRPTDPAHESDVRSAEQTRVEYLAGRLLIKTPKQRGLSIFGRTGSVDVSIELPAGSSLDADASVAAFWSSGRLGECRVKNSTGNLQFEHTGLLELSTDGGTIVVNQVDGDATVSGMGKVRLHQISGSAVIKNANGDNWIGEVHRDLHTRTANGDITVGRTHASVKAVTANGDIRIGELARGSASLKSACGEIEIGIRPGTAARLDVRTSYGRVANQMDAVQGPGSSDETVDVRAHTSYGDILIHRSQPSQQIQDAPARRPQPSQTKELK